MSTGPLSIYQPTRPPTYLSTCLPAHLIDRIASNLIYPLYPILASYLSIYHYHPIITCQSSNPIQSNPSDLHRLVCLSMCLSIDLSICLSVYLPDYLSICWSIIYRSTSLATCLFHYLSTSFVIELVTYSTACLPTRLHKYAV